jgi:hypothetical protein
LSDTPSDPTTRPRRTDSRREPATIDLSATEVRAEPGAGPEEPRPTPDEVIPSDTPGSSPSDLAAEPETSVPPARPGDPPRRGLGFPALLGAGLVGGLVGAGATALTESWWRPRQSGTEARLAQVEQRIAAAPNLAPLETRLSALASETKALGERLGAVNALAERGAKQAQEALDRPPPAPSPAADNAASASAVADLGNRLAALEKQAEARAQALTALENQTQERAQAVSSAQERLSSVEQRAQGATAAAQSLERRIADQDQRLAALAKQVAERGSDGLTAGLRVTLADRLADALREGAPAGQTLAMLGRLGAKPDLLRPIEPYAQSAPPSAAALAQEFKPIGERMIAEGRTPAADWSERVWRMLDRVVTVRAVGDPKASDVASLVSRIENALERGAVGDALAAWNALPEPSRRLAPEWGARLQQRAAAETAAQTIYAEALSALEASTR